MGVRQRGRPRAFDPTRAIRRAVDVFWTCGYGATSLQDLLGAMKISRSSFYAAFGSKHAVMLAALGLYTNELLERMRAAADAATDPRAAVAAVLEIVACSERPAYGCLFVNTATELAPLDARVRAFCCDYLMTVDALVVSLLRQAGLPPQRARHRAGALLALATGAVTLRKAGESAQRVRAMLDLLPTLMR